VSHLQNCIDDLMNRGQLRHIAVRAGRNDEVLIDTYRGLDRQVTPHTLFDMASVTKIMETTMLALMAMDRGWITPDTPVSRFFPVPEYRQEMTIRHLMTHSSGISNGALRNRCSGHADAAQAILQTQPASPVGTEVLYSCWGFILLGKIVERLWGEPLDRAFDRHVALPLGMTRTTCRPLAEDTVNSNLRPEDCGLVNDHNSRFLDGISGNAGLFSCMEDATLFAQMMLKGGAPLVSQEIFRLAAQDHTPGMSEGRGLGFLYVDERYSQTGRLFPAGSIGHCGHTGQSLFVDPASGLYAIILSDATISGEKKFGYDKYDEVTAMREVLHNALLADLKGE